MDYRLLHAKTVAELRALAREEKIKIPTGASKAKIVELLLEVENQRAADLALRQAEAQRSAEQKLAQKQAEAEKAKADAAPAAEPLKKKRGCPPKVQKTEEAQPEAAPADAAADNAQNESVKETVAEPTRPEKKDSDGENTPPPQKTYTPVQRSRAPQDSAASSPAQNARPTENRGYGLSAYYARRQQQETPPRFAQRHAADRTPARQDDRNNYPADRAPARQDDRNNYPADRTPVRQDDRSNYPADRTPARQDDRNNYPADRAPARQDDRSNYPADRAPARQDDRSNYPADRAFPRRDDRSSVTDDRMNMGFDRQRLEPDRKYYTDQSGDSPKTSPAISYRRESGAYRQESSELNANRREPGAYRQESPESNGYRRESGAYRQESPDQNGYRREPGANRQDQAYSRPVYARREHVPQDPNEVTQAVSDLLAAGDCAEGGGVLEPMPDGYGFLRAENYQQGTKDVYVSAAQIRRFNLRMGDLVRGKVRPQREGDRYTGLLFIDTVNGESPEKAMGRPRFEDLTPIYPHKRIRLEGAPCKNDTALRVIDLLAPIGRGQRAMIVSQPKAGKTVLLKKIANAITENEPDIELIVLLIDERPEEVTDMQRSIKGDVVYSTFDEVPENHTRVAEMVLERAQRLVEQGKDVVILLDSITRLARAYNLVIPPTGRTLSGGIDPGALHKPKRFFGAARNIENGGSLTIIATALVETGSRMDDIIFEEFKGTGNSEIHLDRRLSEKRIFPAIDMNKSGTRREDLLFTPEEAEGALAVRRMLSGGSNQDAVEQLTSMLHKTQSNAEFLQQLRGLFAKNEKDGFSYGGR